MKAFFISIVLLLLSLYSYGQNKPGREKDTVQYFQLKNQIHTTGTPEGELYLFYERFLRDRISVEVSAGYKGARLGSVNSVGYFTTGVNPAAWYSGFNSSLAFKHYLSLKKHPWYVSFSGFVKFYSFPEITVKTDEDEYYMYYEKWSGTKAVFGSKLLFGKKWILACVKDVAVYGDLYMGLGARQKIHDNLIHARFNNQTEEFEYFDTPEKGRITQPLGSIHLGFKLGIGF